MSRVHRRQGRSAAVLAGVLIVAGIVTGIAGTSAASGTRQNHTPRVAPIGTFAVGQISQTFIDLSRPTNANGTFPGSSSRTLLTAISDYPLSNTNAPGGVDFNRGVADVKNQPADASFVLTQVLKLDQTKKLVGGTIDQQHLGAAGHSLGVTTPLLAVHGNADPIVSYQVDVNGFANASPPKYFLTFVGGGHITPYVGASATDPEVTVLQRTTIDFWNRYLKGDRPALAQLKTDSALPGSTTLEDDAAPAAATRTK